jgi:hypothetical protein
VPIPGFPVSALCLDAIDPHEPRDTILAAAFTLFAEILADSATTIASVAFGLGFPDERDKSLILDGSRRVELSEPGVKSASMHPKNPAYRWYFEHGPMILDERVPYLDAFAKYAAVFFRMSRSSLVRLSSTLSRDTSSRRESTLSVAFEVLAFFFRSRSQV